MTKIRIGFAKITPNGMRRTLVRCVMPPRHGLWQTLKGIARYAEKLSRSGEPRISIRFARKAKPNTTQIEERNIERAKLWNASNPERFRESCRRWANKNPQKLRAYERNRKLAKIERTPPWYGEFDQFVFEEAFSLARQREEMTGIGWHVDHMLPLRGRRVSGLHAGINAQVIPAALNLSKGNKMLYTKPGEWVRAI